VLAVLDASDDRVEAVPLFETIEDLRRASRSSTSCSPTRVSRR
jgi:phosphoenolpyruvate carboxylase